jgi:hypothetical protein
MTETTGEYKEEKRKWFKPSEKHPGFKKIVLGLVLPNKVDLVVLDRIDENGPIFHRANYGIGIEDFFSIRKTVDIDLWSEIDLPEDSTN